MLSKKEIEKIYFDARSEDLMSNHSIEKYAFTTLLTGMIIKLTGKKGEGFEANLEALRRMERFLERMTYQNVIQSIQSRLIVTQDRQISILEQEKSDLIEENIKLKKNIR